MSTSIGAIDVPISAATSTTNPKPKAAKVSAVIVPNVPFYSQFSDISSPYWQKRGCGIASLAMLIDFYNDEIMSVDSLLEQGRNSGAYIKNAGWSHQGLINLSKDYGLTGKTYDFSNLSNEEAFSKFKEVVKEGPVIVSVHYKFEPTNPIPHLAVITGIKSDVLYYNDPAVDKSKKKISKEKFINAWKKRLITIRKPLVK